MQSAKPNQMLVIFKISVYLYSPLIININVSNNLKNMSESVFFKIFDFFFDNTKRISSKLLIILLILTSLWLIDNVFYFSKNAHFNYKVKQINEINEILKDSLLFSNSEKQELIQIRKNILKEKYVFDFDNYYSRIDSNLFNKEVNKTQIIETQIKKNKFKELKKSLWYNLFSIFLPVSLLLILISNLIETLTDKEKRKNLDSKHFYKVISIIFLLIFLSYLSFYIAQITPIFFESHLWVNYVYNLYVPLLIILVFGLIASKVIEITYKFKKGKESDI